MNGDNARSKSPKTRNSPKVMTVAGFVVIAAAVAVVFPSMGVGRLPAPANSDENVYVMQNGHRCFPEGSATSETYKAMNVLKNRNAAPKEEEIDPFVSMAALVAPGQDESRFSQDKGARITGYVMDVQVGGKESCNCMATNHIDMDTHISLALSPDATMKNQWVIVEVTPRLRKQMKDQGKDWSTDALKSDNQGIAGRWVEVTGWLLFDIAHRDGAENTNPGNPSNWRATCWEIHPITRIKLLDGAPEGASGFQPAMLAAFQKVHAKHVQQNPQAQELMRQRQKAWLDKLSDDERKEIEEEKREHAR
jgi:hypothetical protein